jgi:hypothetical protein
MLGETHGDHDQKRVEEYLKVVDLEAINLEAINLKVVDL